MDVLCIRINLKGFSSARIETKDLCLDSNAKVRQIISKIRNELGIDIDEDEVMVICNDTQLYLEETIPANCIALTLFPLALGGATGDDVALNSEM